MEVGRLHFWRPRSMTIPVGAAAPSTQRAGADTRGIGPLWALLGTFGGNWQIRGEFP